MAVAVTLPGAAGAAGAGPANSPMLRRPPVTVRPFSDAVGVAIAASRMTSLIRLAETHGRSDAYNAAAPVTWGVAIDVPLMLRYVLPGAVEMMPLPGAPKSTLVLP